MEQETTSRALSFMGAAREAVQWQANQDVLAQLERTPYMDKCAYAAASMLARTLPGSELLVVSCGARAKPGKASIPSRRTREWLVRSRGQMFGIEGLFTEAQAKEQTLKRWFQKAPSDNAKSPIYDVVVHMELASPKPPRGMEATDPIMARIVSRLEGPLATLVIAPGMEEATIKAKAPSPAPRF